MTAIAPLIAVVDDDASVRRALQRLVQAAGYPVETFASAHEFLDSARSRGTACLILDIYLDGMNGFELQERLAASQVSIPIVFITGHDDAVTRERLRASVGAGYLTKPFDGQVLLDMIRRAIGSA